MGGIAQDGEVVMGMDVDEARRQDPPAEIDRLRGLARHRPADIDDAPLADGDLAPEPGRPGTIHDFRVDELAIEHLGHDLKKCPLMS